jgi:hypothetical protein
MTMRRAHDESGKKQIPPSRPRRHVEMAVAEAVAILLARGQCQGRYAGPSHDGHVVLNGSLDVTAERSVG